MLLCPHSKPSRGRLKSVRKDESRWTLDCAPQKKPVAARLLTIHHSGELDTPAARENRKLLNAARELDFPIWEMPANWLRETDAETGLANFDRLAEPAPALFNGYVLQQTDYAELYEACRRRNVLLLNDPEQYRRGHRFDEVCDRIAEWTPRTELVGIAG